MNPTPTIHEPELPALPGMEKSFVGVHIGNDKSGLVFSSLAAFLPPNNFVGLLLLRRLLTHALNHAGLLAGPLSISGPMDDCIILIGVTNAPAAVEIIKPELQAAILLSFSQIGILDGTAGDRWRCVFPSAAVRLEWLLDDERHGPHNLRLMENLRASTQATADLARSVLARSDLTPEQRKAITASLRAAEQEIASFTPPPDPGAQ